MTTTSTPATPLKPRYRLRDLDVVRRVGHEYICVCPHCGKRHLNVSIESGLMHCWSPGCGLTGRLIDADAPADAPRRPRRGEADDEEADAPFRMKPDTTIDEMPLLPSELKSLHPVALADLLPIDGDGEPTAEQTAARAYLRAMAIPLDTATQMGVMCCRHLVALRDGTADVRPCLAYVNRIDGAVVAVKYRSCDADLLPAPDGSVQFVKAFSHNSANKPAPPYNIDCINPMRYNALACPDGTPCPAGRPQRVVIVEGEKDCLALRAAGIEGAISVASGGVSDPGPSFAPFMPWLDGVRDVVICTDHDRVGRFLRGKLTLLFRERCLIADMPAGCKDIAEVLAAYGPEIVREVIDRARPDDNGDVVRVAAIEEGVRDILAGHFDHGHTIGYGPLTDRIFRLTDEGGLIICTGQPNAGKTDWLNDMLCRQMAVNDKHVCFCSFENPNKAKHTARFVSLLLGRKQFGPAFADYDFTPALTFLDRHLSHIDIAGHAPTVRNILTAADVIDRGRRVDFLVIDPYALMEINIGRFSSETQAIKRMLSELQSWGRRRAKWVVVVAHPRKLSKLEGSNELERIDMYTISGSANWANLADYLFSISRSEGDGQNYTTLDMLKVRDQDICQKGKVIYVRQPSGRYDERPDVETVRAEQEGGLPAPHDTDVWI